MRGAWGGAKKVRNSFSAQNCKVPEGYIMTNLYSKSIRQRLEYFLFRSFSKSAKALDHHTRVHSLLTLPRPATILKRKVVAAEE